MLTFDDYLTTRIKLGKAQYTAFLILSLIEFMSGFQEIFQTILVRLLYKEWNITVFQQAMLGVFFFTGIMLGNLICSMTADRIGRKRILIISQSSSVAMMLFNSFAQEYYEAALTLLLYGIVFGISMPISQVMASEIAPVRVRGRFILMLQFIYILGILYLILQCTLFLDSIDRGDWRNLLRVNIIPPILCLLGSIFYLIDSPRLYIIQGRYEEGFELMDRMGALNDPYYEKMNMEEQQAMKEWSIRDKPTQQATFKDLFNQSILKVTMFILGLFTLYNMVSCGIIVITPFLVGEANRGFFDLFLAYLIEIPAIMFSFLLFENRKWGGRIKVTLYGMLIMTISQIMFAIFKYSFITIGLILLRFSFRIIWSGLNVLPAESYSTHLRTLGVGTAQGSGKIAGAVSSLITLPLFYHSHFLPFIFGSLITSCCVILLICYPIDTTQRPLDQQKPQNKEVEAA